MMRGNAVLFFEVKERFLFAASRMDAFTLMDGKFLRQKTLSERKLERSTAYKWN